MNGLPIPALSSKEAKAPTNHMNETATSHFIVALLTMAGFSPVFRSDSKLILYSSAQEAQADIDELLREVAEEVANGNMDAIYEMEDYTIIPVCLQGERIEFSFDGNRYSMALTDEEPTIL